MYRTRCMARPWLIYDEDARVKCVSMRAVCAACWFTAVGGGDLGHLAPAPVLDPLVERLQLSLGLNGSLRRLDETPAQVRRALV
jgi:hypothetical protein